MDKLPRSVRWRLMTLLFTALVTACQSATPTSPVGAPNPGVSISIADSTCPSLIVTVLQQVTWTNEDDQVHFIKMESLEGEVMFDSGELQPGDTASFTFPQSGTFSYVCSSDQESTGTITVQP